MAILFASVGVWAQTPPSEAQIKKDLMNPGVIAIIIRGKGSFEKFVENRAVVNEYYRSVTVRRKSDKPGITLDVLGDVVYRLIGGRWVYRRMRLGGNTYGGIANPTAAELSKLVEKLTPNDVDNVWQEFVGEIESIKLSPFPNWQWHTPNSVSFNIVMIHSQVLHGGVTWEDVLVARVERIQRWRIYRDSEKDGWKSMTVEKAGRKGDLMRDENNKSIEMFKILESKKMTRQQTDNMPRPTKVPPITE
jgi:hypothetical protein